MTSQSSTAIRGTSTGVPTTATNGGTVASAPDPAVLSSLLRQGVAPHIAIASARARAQGRAARKRRIRAAAAFYDRVRDLPPLWPRHLDAELLAADPDIGMDWTRHILLRLARLLKYHRSDPQGRASMATNIAIAMIGEAAILRRQRDRRQDCPVGR